MNTTITVGGILLAALMLTLPALAGPAAEDIQIDEPYVRAVPAMMKNSAVFLSMKNTGDTNHALVSASSSAAEVVELHNHVQDGDVMRMRKIDEIGIAAGATTVLQPGGLHIMLLGLRQELVPDATVSVDLTFADGSRKSLVAPVKSVDGMHHGHGQHHH
jgi:copper(I)-binding protein